MMDFFFSFSWVIFFWRGGGLSSISLQKSDLVFGGEGEGGVSQLLMAHKKRVFTREVGVVEGVGRFGGGTKIFFFHLFCLGGGKKRFEMEKKIKPK